MSIMKVSKCLKNVSKFPYSYIQQKQQNLKLLGSGTWILFSHSALLSHIHPQQMLIVTENKKCSFLPFSLSNFPDYFTVRVVQHNGCRIHTIQLNQNFPWFWLVIKQMKWMAEKKVLWWVVRILILPKLWKFTACREEIF